MPSQVNVRSRPFATKLRQLMQDQRVSLNQLARDAEISVSVIGRYRTGQSEPRDHFGDPTPNAFKLAQALNVPVDELLPPVEKPNGETPVAA